MDYFEDYRTSIFVLYGLFLRLTNWYFVLYGLFLRLTNKYFFVIWTIFKTNEIVRLCYIQALKGVHTLEMVGNSIFVLYRLKCYHL